MKTLKNIIMVVALLTSVQVNAWTTNRELPNNKVEYSFQSLELKMMGFSGDIQQRLIASCLVAIQNEAQDHGYKTQKPLIANDGVVVPVKKKKIEKDMICNTNSINVDANGFHVIIDELTK